MGNNRDPKLDELKKQEQESATQPAPNPISKPQRDLPVNPRDMTPGRRGQFQTR